MRRKSTSERNVLAQSVAMDTEILDQERSEECSLQERHRAVIFTFSLDCSIPRPFCMLSKTTNYETINYIYWIWYVYNTGPIQKKNLKRSGTFLRFSRFEIFFFCMVPVYIYSYIKVVYYWSVRLFVIVSKGTFYGT